MSKIHQKAIATVESTDDDRFGPNGGFTAVLSTPSLDRDGDKLFREEWQEPLPAKLPLDVDHGMTVADTIGSFRPYFEDDRLMMDAHFASTPKAQEVRTLVKEGHISTVSVAFMTDKSKKDGEPRRELLNAGVVAIPSNRDAVILDSKALDKRAEELAEERIEAKADKEPYGDVEYADPGYQSDGKKRYPINTAEHVRAAWSYINQEKNASAYTAEQLDHIKSRIRSAAEKFGVHLDGKTATVHVDVLPHVDMKAFAAAVAEGFKAAGAETALLQAIHDAAVHLGAMCQQLVDDGVTADTDDDGKSADEVETKEPSLAEVEEMLPEDISMERFQAALELITQQSSDDESDTPQESPAEDSPAEAAAATDEVPAPAVDAAEPDAAESDVARRARMLELLIFANSES